MSDTEGESHEKHFSGIELRRRDTDPLMAAAPVCLGDDAVPAVAESAGLEGLGASEPAAALQQAPMDEVEQEEASSAPASSSSASAEAAPGTGDADEMVEEEEEEEEELAAAAAGAENEEKGDATAARDEGLEAGGSTEANTRSADQMMESDGASSMAAEQPRSKKLKKNQSAFMIYCNAHREQVKQEQPGLSMTELTKALAAKWRELEEPEKAQYTKLASDDKERYQREFKEQLAQGVSEAELRGTTQSNQEIPMWETVIPIGRVRRTCKLDPDVKNISKVRSKICFACFVWSPDLKDLLPA